MVRFKVIKASHLLLCTAAVLLAIVIGGIILSVLLSSEPESKATQADFVQHQVTSESEAKTVSVFASLDSSEQVYALDPELQKQLTIEILRSTEAPEKRPSILIYHTHTHEAYEQVPDNRYVAIEAWRTMDHDHSIVRVGEELASLLRAYHFDVVHDLTDHEQDDLQTAYTRSLETLQGYEKKFDLYIDLHRDAYFEGAQLSLPDGERSLAQLMVLIGNGEGFNEKPFYVENLSFAESLTEQINDLKPGLCKDVLVKDGRYNQHIGVHSILIEVGHNKNTLNEALASLPYLAQGIADTMNILEETGSSPGHSSSKYIDSCSVP